MLVIASLQPRQNGAGAFTAVILQRMSASVSFAMDQASQAGLLTIPFKLLNQLW